MCWLYRDFEVKETYNRTHLPDPTIANDTASASKIASTQVQTFAPISARSDKHTIAPTLHLQNQTDTNLGQASQVTSSTDSSSDSPHDLLDLVSNPSSAPLGESREPKRPFEQPPSAANYLHQGGHLCEILDVLLTKRNVLPKSAPRETDGMLLMDDDTVDPHIKVWFRGIKLTRAKLAELAKAQVCGQGSERVGWKVSVQDHLIATEEQESKAKAKEGPKKRMESLKDGPGAVKHWFLEGTPAMSSEAIHQQSFAPAA